MSRVLPSAQLKFGGEKHDRPAVWTALVHVVVPPVHADQADVTEQVTTAGHVDVVLSPAQLLTGNLAPAAPQPGTKYKFRFCYNSGMLDNW